MSVMAAPPSVMSLIAVVYMLYIFSMLSRRLGTVTKMKPYYRGLYLGMALIVPAIVAHLLRVVLWLDPKAMPEFLADSNFYLFVYYVPLALAVTISLVIVLRYWRWLFTEHN